MTNEEESKLITNLVQIALHLGDVISESQLAAHFGDRLEARAAVKAFLDHANATNQVPTAVKQELMNLQADKLNLERINADLSRRLAAADAELASIGRQVEDMESLLVGGLALLERAVGGQNEPAA